MFHQCKFHPKVIVQGRGLPENTCTCDEQITCGCGTPCYQLKLGTIYCSACKQIYTWVPAQNIYVQVL
jgi:uncharacterized Zn finger protein (UPF0148 family)